VIYCYPSLVGQKKFGELFLLTKSSVVSFQPTLADTVPSAYAYAFEFGSHDFARTGISTP